MKISEIRFLRKIGLPILRKTAFDIRIRHPFVPTVRIFVNSYLHKGYWYHGKRREEETMQLFSKMIKPGMNVVEVGGHIGFISVYFMHLVGPEGYFAVFEPGSNNLPYIRRNLEAAKQLKTDFRLIEKAAGEKVGEITFYEDSLSGQNNSAIKDFSTLKSNAEFAFASAKTTEHIVPMTTIDAEFLSGHVDFIKIDVESFEKSVVLGAEGVIEKHKPMIMIEITADKSDLFEFFTERGYLLFLPNREKVLDPSQLDFNCFALHKIEHAEVIRDLFAASGQSE